MFELSYLQVWKVPYKALVNASEMAFIKYRHFLSVYELSEVK